MDGGDTLESLRRRLQRICLDEEEVVALIAREELRVSHRLRDAAVRNVTVVAPTYGPGDRIEVLNPGSSGRYGTVTRATNRWVHFITDNGNTTKRIHRNVRRLIIEDQL